MARRVGYVEGFKKKFKDTPVIQAELGSFFQAAPVMGWRYRLNENVARAFSRLPVAHAIRLAEDLAYAKKLLARDGLDERVRSLPMIKEHYFG